jgi:vacuolar-type H+-ATPase subunit H
MAESTLQRLLEAEARAQAIIDRASSERQRLIDEALAAAREAEARFDAGRAELRAPYVAEAHARAEQAVAELTRKYAERQRMLRDLASRHESEAVEAALALLLDPSR